MGVSLFGRREHWNMKRPAEAGDATEAQDVGEELALGAMVFPQAPLSELDRQDEKGVRWALPVHVRVEVFPLEPNTECFLIATENQLGWGANGDGLTACAGVDRAVFDFRLEVFGAFLKEGARHGNQQLHLKQWNSMALALSEDRATYWVNDRRVHSVKLEKGNLATTRPYIGVYCFSTKFKFRDFQVSRDPQLLAPVTQLVLAVEPRWAGSELKAVAFRNLAGAVIHESEAFGALEWAQFLQHMLPHLAQHFGLLAWDLQRNACFLLPSGAAAEWHDPTQLAQLLKGPE